MVRRSSWSWVLGIVLITGLAAGLPLAAYADPIAYSVRSDGNDGQDDYLYRIDLATGVATPLGPTGFEDVEGLSFNADCATLYGVDDTTDRLLTCDTETGACTQVGALGVDITDTGLAFLGTRLFMSTDAPKNPSRFYQVDPLLGTATLVGPQPQEVTGLAAGPLGVFGLGGDGRDNLVEIDPVTGAATVIGSLGTVEPSDGGLDFDAEGVLWGIEDRGLRNPSRIFRVSTTTGAATLGPTVHLANNTNLVGFEGLAIDEGVCSVLAAAPGLTDVPTLGEWGLIALTALLSLAGLAVLRRRRTV
jgi:hypothetical protein